MESEIVARLHDDAGLVAVAEALLRYRRARDSIFGAYPGLFQEPSWTILLEAFLYQFKRAGLSISSATLATGAPSTTALRHVRELEHAGLIHIRGDPFDGRRRYVTLSEHGDRLVRQTLSWHREHRP